MAKQIWRAGKIVVKIVPPIMALAIILYGPRLFTSAQNGELPPLNTAQSQLDQAQTYEQNGQFALAIAAYQNILEQYPNTDYAFEALRNLIILHIGSGNFLDAQQRQTELTTDFPDHPALPEALFQTANKYEGPWKYEQAKNLYALVIQDFPLSPYADRSQFHLQKADVFSLINAADYTAAQTALDDLTTNFPDHPSLPEVVFHAARRFERPWEYDQASSLYQQVIDEFPESSYAAQARFHRQKSEVFSLIMQGRYTAAETALDQLTADSPQHTELPAILYEIAARFEAPWKYRQAKDLYGRIIELDPNSESAARAEFAFARVNIFALINESDFLAAETALDRITVEFPNEPSLPNVLFQAAGRLEGPMQYELAQNTYNQIIQWYPDSNTADQAALDVARNGVNLLLPDGDPNAVASAIDALITDFPDHPSLPGALNGLALRNEELGHYDQALELYQYIFDNFPDAPSAIPALKGLATVNIKLQDPPAATAAADELLYNYTDDERTARALSQIADAYRSRADYQKADELYQYVLDNFPDSEHTLWALRGRALLNIATSDEAAAQAIIAQLLANYPAHCINFSIAVFEIAEEYTYQLNYESALLLLELIVSEYTGSPMYPQAAYLLAQCYEQKNDYPIAIEHYTSLTEDYPQSPQGRRCPYRIALLSRRLGNYPQALLFFDLQRGLYDDEPLSKRALFSQAIVYLFDQKDYSSARDSFQEYLELYPQEENAPLALYNQALSQQQLGNTAAAKLSLEKALIDYPDNIYAADITDKLAQLPQGGI